MAVPNPAGANGETVRYSATGGDVWWSSGADNHLSIAFDLELEGTEIASGKKPAAVHVSHGDHELDERHTPRKARPGPREISAHSATGSLAA